MPAKTPSPDPFEQLRRAREAAGDTVDSLATRAGVDPGWLAGVEAGTDPGDDKALGLVGNALSLNLDDIFGRARRRTTSSSRSTTSRAGRTTRAASSDMDAALRSAVRAEMAPVERLLHDLVEELGRVRRAQEETADRVARLGAAGTTAKAGAAKKAKKSAARSR